MQAEKKREEIKQLYHQYRQGKMGKAEYLARKKWEGNLAEEMEAELAGLKTEEERLWQRIEETDEDSVSIMEGPGCRGDKRKLLQCLIGNVDVYSGKTIEIEWKFWDRLETGTYEGSLSK